MSVDRAIEKAAEEIVETRIRLAVAEALAKDPRALIERMVDAALAQRDDRWSNQTILQTTIKQMVVEEVKAAFAEWVDEHRQAIRQAVAKRLRATKEGVIDRMADRIMEGLESDFQVSFRIVLE
ncbi:MAG TPA: hypothetical protein VNO79_10605 [Actinomycetota bacterium]|nr:hypothetical protein [Actinomycetota bacterium]